MTFCMCCKQNFSWEPEIQLCILALTMIERNSPVANPNTEAQTWRPSQKFDCPQGYPCWPMVSDLHLCRVLPPAPPTPPRFCRRSMWREPARTQGVPMSLATRSHCGSTDRGKSASVTTCHHDFQLVCHKIYFASSNPYFTHFNICRMYNIS